MRTFNSERKSATSRDGNVALRSSNVPFYFEGAMRKTEPGPPPK